MKRTAFLQALVLAALLVISWILLLNRFRPPAPMPGETTAEPASAAGTPQPDVATPAAGPAAGTAPEPLEPPAGWREWTDYLARSASPGGQRAALEELRKALFGLPPEEAVARIMELLESGFDLPTGLLFQVGPGGRLAGAPSLRVQLLDWLGQLDPARAAAFARQQLESQGTRLPVDAYVVHLRNFAWGTAADDPGGSAFLGDRFAVLLENSAWLADSGPAVAEALDIAVYLRDPRWVAELAGLAGAGRPRPLRHAAGLALERLVDADPPAAVAALLGSPAGAALDPQTRAGLVARLDAGDPASRALLRDYLLAPGTSAGEAAAFLNHFPNLSLSYSHNLLSANPDAAARAPAMARLASALKLVDAWLQDPACAPLKPDLLATRDRLHRQMTGEPAP